MKLKYNLLLCSSLICLNFMNSALASSAPACPPLNGYAIFSVTDRYGSWEAFFRGPGIMNGGIIGTAANNQTDAKTIAMYAMLTSKPSGYARQVFWNDGSWFWACSNLVGNYTLVQSTTDIFVSSPDYMAANNSITIKNQHSAQEQHDRMLSFHGNAL